MSKLMNVSVIVPAFNEEKFLSRAINSILGQTRLPIEILVIDDGSTDRTAEIAQGFEGIVRYIYQNNTGLAGARNKGISVAVGEYIGFLDADDKWNPKFLEYTEGIFNNHPNLNWCTCAYQRVGLDGRLEFTKEIPIELYKDNVINNYFSVEAGYHFSITNTMIIKSHVFNEVGKFDENISEFGEDLDMWFRIAIKYPVLGYTPYVGSIYYKRVNSITARPKTDISRYISTVQKTESAAIYAGKEAILNSDVVVLDWVWKGVKLCVKQCDRSSLNYLIRIYASRLPWNKRLVLLIVRIIPFSSLNYIFNIYKKYLN